MTKTTSFYWGVNYKGFKGVVRIGFPGTEKNHASEFEARAFKEFNPDQFILKNKWARQQFVKFVLVKKVVEREYLEETVD